MAKFAASTETNEPCLTDRKLASSLPIISRLVADTGATGHFLESSTSYTNKLIAHLGISVLLPNHGVMESTTLHNCLCLFYHLKHARRTYSPVWRVGIAHLHQPIV